MQDAIKEIISLHLGKVLINEKLSNYTTYRVGGKVRAICYPKGEEELVKNNSALLLEEKDFNSENLLKKIDLLLGNSVLYKEISENAKKLSVITSSDKIYEEIKKVLGG